MPRNSAEAVLALLFARNVSVPPLELIVGLAEPLLRRPVPTDRMPARTNGGFDHGAGNARAAGSPRHRAALLPRLHGTGPETDGARWLYADVAVLHDGEIGMKWVQSISQESQRNDLMVRVCRKWSQYGDSAAANRWLDQSGWSKALVAQARGEAPGQ